MLHGAKPAFTIAPKMLEVKIIFPTAEWYKPTKASHEKIICLSHDVTIEILSMMNCCFYLKPNSGYHTNVS
jgi:hypothetical protein